MTQTTINPADLWPDADPADALPAEPDLIDTLDQYEPGSSFVRCTSCTGRVFAGIVVATNYDDGTVEARVFDRQAQKWVVPTFPYTQVAPMLTGLSEAQRTELATILLTTGKLPATWQAFDALAQRETESAPAVAEAL